MDWFTQITNVMDPYAVSYAHARGIDVQPIVQDDILYPSNWSEIQPTTLNPIKQEVTQMSDYNGIQSFNGNTTLQSTSILSMLSNPWVLGIGALMLSGGFGVKKLLGGNLSKLIIPIGILYATGAFSKSNSPLQQVVATVQRNVAQPISLESVALGGLLSPFTGKMGALALGGIGAFLGSSFLGGSKKRRRKRYYPKGKTIVYRNNRGYRRY